jgi:DNA topoisomerase-1
MENQLDEIAADGMVWHELCYKCWFDVAAQLRELKERGIVKEEIHIDDRHSYIMGKNGPVIRCRVADDTVSTTIHTDSEGDTGGDDDASDVSETIHKKPKFIFKSVRPDLEYAKIMRGEYSLAYMLGEAVSSDGASASSSSPAPISVTGGRLMGQYHGQDVIIKSGKYGAYVTWGNTNLSLRPLLQQGGGAPTIAVAGGKYAHKSKITTNQKSEFDLTLEDVIKFIERNSAPVVVIEDKDGEPAASVSASASTSYVQGQILRTLDENTTIRYGRYGPYIFHKTQKMTKPAFVALKGFAELHGNYNTCDAAILREWIAADAAAPAKPKPKFGFFKKK